MERVAGIVVVSAEELTLFFKQSQPELAEICVKRIYLIGDGETAP